MWNAESINNLSKTLITLWEADIDLQYNILDQYALCLLSQKRGV
jgi:hypothetical protein